MPLAFRTTYGIPASSKCSVCRRGRSLRMPPTSILGSVRDADARRGRPGAQLRRPLPERSGIRAGRRLRCARLCRKCRRLTEASKHIMVEETRQGLNIEIVDQDGRSMFPEGTKEPYERTRKIIQKIAPARSRQRLIASPSPAIPPRARCRINQAMGRGNFPPTAPIRCAKFSMGGVPSAHVYMVAGKADTDPLFPDDPYHVAQSPRHHHLDAGRAACSGRFEPVAFGGALSLDRVEHSREIVGIAAKLGNDIRPASPLQRRHRNNLMRDGVNENAASRRSHCHQWR